MFRTLRNLRMTTIEILSFFTWLPPTLARLTLGIVFFNSGRGKLSGLPQVIEYFQNLGIPVPQLQAPVAAWTELICGGLLILGLFSRLASVPLMLTMVVAILTARKAEIEGIGGLLTLVEYLYILLLAGIGISGPGPLSLDRLIFKVRAV